MSLLLNVPYSEEDEVKALGAEWSPNLKKCYVKNRNDYHKFKKWIIGDENAVSIISKYLYILEEIVTCKNCHEKTSFIINAVKDLYIIEKSENGILFNNFNTTEKNNPVRYILGQPIYPLPVDVEFLLKQKFNYYMDKSPKYDETYYYNHCQHCNTILKSYIHLDELDDLIIGNVHSNSFNLYKIHLQYDFISELVVPEVSPGYDEYIEKRFNVINLNEPFEQESEELSDTQNSSNNVYDFEDDYCNCLNSDTEDSFIQDIDEEIKEILSGFISSIDDEIDKKNQASKSRPLKLDGFFSSDNAAGKIYYFLDCSKQVSPDTAATITIIINGKKQIFESIIIKCEDNTLELLISCKESDNIPENIYKAEIVIDDVAILKRLKETILKIKSGNDSSPQQLAKKAFLMENISSSYFNINNFPVLLNNSQKEAIKLCLGSDVTYIWGPPGTGKSKTLKVIAEELLKQNKSILVSAHTNEAVDNLMEKLINCFTEKDIKNSKILRWKLTQSKAIQHITPAGIISKKTKDINSKIDSCKAEKVELQNKLKKIRKILDDYKEYTAIGVYIFHTKEKNTKILSELNNLESQKNYVLSALSSDITELEKFESKNIIYQRLNSNKKLEIEHSIRQNRMQIKMLGNRILSTKSDYENTKNTLVSLSDKYNILQENLNFSGFDFNDATLHKKEHITIKKLEMVDKEIDLLNQELKTISNSENELLKNAIVVGATLTSVALNSNIRTRSFDVVIVDEVSMAPCPSLYVACSLASNKIILCGDFYQLSPIATSKTADWLRLSIFDKLGITTGISNNIIYKELAILDTQYRCHPDIADSIKDIVYKGKLQNGLKSSHNDFHSQQLEPYPNKALILIDTSRLSTAENPWCEEVIKGSSTSYINKNTAQIGLNCAITGLNSGIKSIGIITPYAEQAKLYKEQISSLKKSYPSKKIEAATVHKYQGREMDMIIFDLVDCYDKSLGKLLSGEHGSDAMRLINVATTRARSKFIVIANVSYINKNLYKWKNNILFQWIQYLSKNAFVDYL